MAKGGGHEAPKAHSGGGGGHSMEKAAKALESAVDLSEWGMHFSAPTIGAGWALAKGLDIKMGYALGLVYALGFSFVKELLKGGLGGH